MAKAKTTEEKPLTLAQKLSKVNKDNPDSAKKVEEKKDTEKKSTTLKEVFDKITFKNKQASDVSDLQSENKKLRDMISEQKKSKRGPSSAGRISGLQTLNPRLGQQFS